MFSEKLKKFQLDMEPVEVEPHFDISINENSIINGAEEIVKLLRPSWPSDQLSHKVLPIKIF